MTSPATQVKRWVWQRASAIILAFCVLVHLGVMIYAVRSGLSAAAILGRTHGNWSFGALYAAFVLACALHVPLGLAAIIEEWLGWRGRTLAVGTALFGLVIASMGLRAVYGVVAA